jgi:hypothetical protein
MPLNCLAIKIFAALFCAVRSSMNLWKKCQTLGWSGNDSLQKQTKA